MKRILLMVLTGMVLRVIPSFGQLAPYENPAGYFTPSQDMNISSVTKDRKGNTYITGFFTDSLRVGSEILYSRGSVDIFLAKFRPDRQIEWIRQAGGSSLDICQYIQADTNDNIYLSGLFKGRLVFEDTALYSKGITEFFTAKYTDEGNMLWIRKNSKYK